MSKSTNEVFSDIEKVNVITGLELLVATINNNVDSIDTTAVSKMLDIIGSYQDKLREYFKAHDDLKGKTNELNKALDTQEKLIRKLKTRIEQNKQGVFNTENEIAQKALEQVGGM